jgi:ATP-dependent helicase IRC3
MNLRPYQIEAIEQITKTFEDQQRQFIEMPTGSGKTITFLTYASQNHMRILVIVPSKELLKQVYESTLMFYHSSHVSRKGDIYNESPAELHICIINSLRGDYLKYILTFSFDLCIIDEAHHSQADSYKRLINNLPTSCNILGVTATPDRLDGSFLKDILDVCSFKIEVFNLIRDGYLCDLEGFTVKTHIDISDVDDHNHDFSINQLFKKLSTQKRNDLIIDICKKEMIGRKTLIFCLNVEHTKQISDLLKKENLSSAHINGKMKSPERNSILSAFRNGEISYLCNCQLLTEGFDEPSIDGVVLARPTKSRTLFNQMIGRGLRIYPGKMNCKIIDIADTHRNLKAFNSIFSNEKYKEISSFKSIKDIKTHIDSEIFDSSEFLIERANLIGELPYKNIYAMGSMIDYLENNNIPYIEPLMFDEASFLIWMHELQKEFINVNNHD